MTERQQVRVTALVVNDYEESEGWPGDLPLAGAISWFKDQLAGLPEVYRDLARWDISANLDGALEIEIYYFRPETDEEFAARCPNPGPQRTEAEQSEELNRRFRREVYGEDGT